MIAGNLKYIVLKLLAKKPLSGYGIMKQIKDYTGCWKPSTGSVYPLLDSMLKEGLLNVTKLERSKVYEITDTGKEELNKLSQHKETMLNHMISEIKLYSSISQCDHANIMAEMLEDIKKDKIPLKELNPEIIELKMLFLQMYKKNIIQRNQKEIKKILKNAINELRNLK